MDKMKEVIRKVGKFIILQLDNFIIIGFAVYFALAGFMGWTDPKNLGPVTLAILGTLAVSQLVNRFQVKKVTDTWHRARTDIFSKGFPDEYDEAKVNLSKSYFYTGQTMGRTMPTMRPHILRLLEEGGSARILLPNPDNPGLMKAIAKTRSNENAESIKHAIETSFRLAQSNNAIELRTTDVMPHIGINGLDIERPSGKIMVQMYEYKPEKYSERAPIFLLEATDGEWFNHFRRQIDRLWEDGKDYVPRVAPKGAVANSGC